MTHVQNEPTGVSPLQTVWSMHESGPHVFGSSPGTALQRGLPFVGPASAADVMKGAA
jgi:hypothetical protein